MSRLLEKYGETLKWGEKYYMLKKYYFSAKSEDPNELQVFNSNKNLGIFRVPTNPKIFPCVYFIT